MVLCPSASVTEVLFPSPSYAVVELCPRGSVTVVERPSLSYPNVVVNSAGLAPGVLPRPLTLEMDQSVRWIGGCSRPGNASSSRVRQSLYERLGYAFGLGGRAEASRRQRQARGLRPCRVASSVNGSDA